MVTPSFQRALVTSLTFSLVSPSFFVEDSSSASSEKDIEKAVLFDQVNEKNVDDIKKYIEWIKSISNNKTDTKAFLNSVDEVLFALGKKIKSGKLTTGST